MAKKSPRNTLTNVAVRHQVFIERFKASESADFAKAFDALNIATRGVLNDLSIANLSDLSKTRLKEALSELRALNGQILTKASEKLFDNLEKLAGYEAGFEARTFQAIKASVRLKEPRAADAFAFAKAQPLSVNGDLLQTFLDKWSAGEVDRVNLTIQKAWGEGWPIDKLTTVLNGTKAKNYSDGLVGFPGSTAASMRRNARTVSRTAIQHVASTGRMATWEANADVITGYRWVATLDNRTTATCRSLDGQLFELGAGPVPPIHMGCRSTTVAEVDPSLDFLDEGATRSSDIGYVSADLSYYDWLKMQPADYQDEALGKSRALLFRKGGLTPDDFAALNIGRDFHPLTLAEMAKLEPLAFQNAGIDVSKLPSPPKN